LPKIDTQKKQFLTLENNPWTKERLFLHAAFWVFIAINIINSIYTDYSPTGIIHFLGIFILVNAILIYFNNYVLVPKFLYSKKYLFYSLIIIPLIFIFSFIEFHLLPIQKNLATENFLFIVPNLAIFVMLATGVKYMRWSNKQAKNIDTLKQKQQLTELAALKSQVNPHFLFNTLNQAYSQSLTEDAPLTSETILSLSSLMKYMLNASKQNIISLESEIKYIDDYIALEARRLGDRLNITYVKEGDFSDIFLPPFLIIPFVENIFKHGQFSLYNTDQVIISIKRQENNLNMYFKNPISEDSKHKKSSSQIGIQNIKRRLDLEFGQHYDLKITENKDHYISELSIVL